MATGARPPPAIYFAAGAWATGWLATADSSDVRYVLESPDYTADLNEIKALGGDAATRSEKGSTTAGGSDCWPPIATLPEADATSAPGPGGQSRHLGPRRRDARLGPPTSSRPRMATRWPSSRASKASTPGRPTVSTPASTQAPFSNLDAWDTPPSEPHESDGWLIGRGAADSKAAVALFAHLAADMQQTASALQGRLLVLFDADEHTGHFSGVKSFLRRYPTLTAR
jgi:hypothetical protein